MINKSLNLMHIREEGAWREELEFGRCEKVPVKCQTTNSP